MEISNKNALRFIIVIGFISLLADMTYEGARSITGPYLGMLGASAALVSLVAGFGELLGYGLRLVSGFISDKTQQYWSITFTGYILNLAAVPLLALAGSWQLAAGLVILERVGKAIRTPARDAMLSYACTRTGAGWGFGLHEAMDQIGAMLGPILIALILYLHGSYRQGFAMLLIPAMLAIVVLVTARILYPQPQHLEIKKGDLHTQDMKSVFWIYLAGAALIAAGYADFPLIAYHFSQSHIYSKPLIPITYAIAMGASALSAILFGHWYDKKGSIVLIAVATLTALFAPFAFLGNSLWALLGVILWGVGMGSQSSLMKALVTQLVPSQKRGSAYGLFNTGYGIAWFLGSALMGILYEISMPLLIAFSVIVQLAAIPLFLLVYKKLKQTQ